MVGLIHSVRGGNFGAAADEAAFPASNGASQWFIENRQHYGQRSLLVVPGESGERRLLSIVNPAHRYGEFSSVCWTKRSSCRHSGIHQRLAAPIKEAIRACSAMAAGVCVSYEPGRIAGPVHFGGNSNWRGPVWFPVNYLIIEALQKFHHYLGDEYKVECPARSGQMMTLWEVAAEISRRLSRLFLKDDNGRRPVHGESEPFHNDPGWNDLVLFYEYFHGETGAGLGASHQTGWTGLVAKLLQQSGE